MIFKFEQSYADGNSDFAELTSAIEFYLEKQPIPLATVTQLMVALDEVISNVLNYSGDLVVDSEAGLNSTLELTVQIDVENDQIVAEVFDSGAFFDPLTLPEPDTTLSLDSRDYGGLGIYIVRKLMDEVTYSRENGWNKLRFSKTFVLD